MSQVHATLVSLSGNLKVLLILSVYFKVFDCDGDGFLTRSDIEVMCKALIEIRKENVGEKVGFQVNDSSG